MGHVSNTIISASALYEIMDSPNLVLIDSSYPNGKATFLSGHIKGAQWVDLDRDLADVKPNVALGGRHPLPAISDFIKVLNRLGISKQSHVVVYDHNSGAFAARMWWMLRAIGHESVEVLDGGFKAAMDHHIPCIIGEIIPNKEVHYMLDMPIENWRLPMCEMSEVEKAAIDGDRKVIDVRAKTRYNGDVEPIDPIAGHIPGAINVPFETHLENDGRYMSAGELKEKYTQVLGEIPSNQTILHCGSGVTACHTALALEIAGFDPPALYIGSWSEWSRNKKPVETKT